jgi:PRC-barrel domain
MMAVGYTFEIDSTVGRYWLAHGAGFDVVAGRGRKVGVVEDVVLDPATQNVSLVLVRRHGRRTAKVPPRALSAVLPASHCFVIDPAALGAKRRAPDLRPALGRLRAGAARVTAAGGHAIAVAARWVRNEWPPARRAIASATTAALQALAAAATGAAAGASRAWREAQQRRRPN